MGELLQELEREAVERATCEAEYLDALQNEEDCWLFEQHCISGVPCPLCGVGRLESRQAFSELRCTSCEEMRVQLMDESLTLDDISEILGMAEDRHRSTCCKSRPFFEIRACGGYSTGPHELFLRCNDCGWHDLVL